MSCLLSQLVLLISVNQAQGYLDLNSRVFGKFRDKQGVVISYVASE
jgi:hypothetical protein